MSSSAPRCPQRDLWRCVLATLFTFAVAACARHSPDADVVARVDGSTITRTQWLRAIDKAFATQHDAADDASRHKILESLVLNRVLARSAKSEQSADDRRQMQDDIDSYREQYLARWYLSRHAQAASVSEKSVHEYYEQHPDQFGGGEALRYELVLTVGALDGKPREDVITWLQSLLAKSAPVGVKNEHDEATPRGALSRRPVVSGGASQDWSAAVAEAAGRGLPILLRSGEADDALLTPRLRAALASATPDSAPQLLFIDGRPYLLRAVGRVSRAPQPLAAVHQEIVEILVANHLKQSIAHMTPTLLDKAHVEYLDTRH